MENFSELIFQPLEKFWSGLMTFVPNLLAMLIIFVGGVVIAWISRVIVQKVLGVANFDAWCDRAGFTAILRKADIWATPSAVSSRVFFWFLVLVFLLVGLGALRLESIDYMNAQFFNYLPRVISAILILVIGYALAGFISRAALIAAVNSGYPYAKLVAQTVRLLIIVLTLAMAFEQLGIAPMIVMAAFSIVFGGIVLAVAISLGVGGIETARKMIEKGGAEEKKEEEQGAEETEKKEEGRDIEFL